MTTRTIAVVSDIFKNMANNETIFTYSQIIKILHDKKLKQSILFIEQGVSENDVAYLKSIIKQLDLLKAITVKSYFDKFQRCKKNLTHKSKNFNTLISEPIEKIYGIYHSILMVDERCAELSDHVTGQHIQGMILMEAARQMTIATLEKYFVENYQNQAVKFVMNEFQCQFYHYAFPIHTKLCLEVKKNEGNGNNRIFTILISIYQNRKKIAEINRKISSYDERFIKYKESIALQAYIKDFLQEENCFDKFEESQPYEKAA